MKIFFAAAILAIASIGCVGLGVTLSPADGEIALALRAQDCISPDNVAGKIVGAVPRFGDWAMLNWGCTTPGPLVGQP
jgi:hypothetical protein